MPDMLPTKKPTLEELPKDPPPKRQRMDRRCQRCESVWFCVDPCPNTPQVTPQPQEQFQKEVHPGTPTIQPRAEPAESLTAPEPRPEAKKNRQAARPEPTEHPFGQTSEQMCWEEVKAILPQKTLRLDRTKPLVEDMLNDEHMTLHLCGHTFEVQHVQSVIANIPKRFRFKIGITEDPIRRYYEAHYAYNKFYIKQKDGVNYEHMLIIRLSHSKDVVAEAEQNLIVHFQKYEPRRCANRKNDRDKKFQNNDTDSEDERSQGPYAVYVVVGKAL